jgi:solute carrier family 35 (adenosine 3'-phospho 5'-phosphosulfate transporter), member B3
MNRYEKVPSGSTINKSTEHDHNSSHTVKILCFDLSKLTKTNQFFLCCVGVFVLYLLYGYFMELIFTLEDFKAFVWYVFTYFSL